MSEVGIDRVYLACGPTDLRKSIDGLAVLVKEAFELDPFAPNLFVFCNRQRDKLKILYWDHNGFWLYYRRLEQGRFQWPMEKRRPRPTHVRYLYSCRHCEREEIRTHVVRAAMPNPVLPGSLVSPSALAYIMEQKYVEGIPFIVRSSS